MNEGSFKLKMYPKTTRFSDEKVILTEKLDGSNLGFFKLNDELYIAQRNNVIPLSNKEEVSYKGLPAWLDIHGEELKNSMNDTSAIFGEWIGMGRLKYPEMNHSFRMFAKTNVSVNSEGRFVTSKMMYRSKLFKSPFVDQEVPSFIKFVPILGQFELVSKTYLDEIYKEYSDKVNRNVEGIIVIRGNDIQKYVRMKSGKLEPHRS